MTNSIKKGTELELVIDDLAFGARGIARMNNFVWFVKGALPGQKVKAIVRRLRKTYGEATIKKVLEPSPDQIDPPCPYFFTCGGCQLQHLDYPIQVRIKTRQIHDLLERIGGLKMIDVCPTIPSEKTYGYRNKMEFTFSDKRWVMENETEDKPKDFALGLHIPGRFDKVLDIDHCMLQSELCNRILRTTKKLTRESGLTPYHIRKHTGFWRFLVIREGKNTGDIMLNIITSGQEGEKGNHVIDHLAQKLYWQHPEITTFIHTISDKRAQVAQGDSERIVLGPGRITEKIADTRFEISPSAFFQTNTLQARHLFETIAYLTHLQGNEIVYDLFCGTGAIGIHLAGCVKKIVGIEAVPSAIEDAARNVELNNLSNVHFLLADMKNAMVNHPSIVTKYGAPDLVILDPPRGGTHPKTIKGLIELCPPKIVYVSCNPAILARDLEILCEKEYSLQTVQPVDMFPHTGHIEVVALLQHHSA